jgi:hypothetical protein
MPLASNKLPYVGNLCANTFHTHALLAVPWFVLSKLHWQYLHMLKLTSDLLNLTMGHGMALQCLQLIPCSGRDGDRIRIFDRRTVNH